MIKLIPLKPDVCMQSGLKPSAIYDRIAKGTFPKPVKIGSASRWVQSQVQEWAKNAVEAGHAE